MSAGTGRLLLAVALLISGPAWAGDWTLIQRDECENEKIASVTHSLSKRECEYMRDRTNGWPATAEEKALAAKMQTEQIAKGITMTGSFRHCGLRAECFK